MIRTISFNHHLKGWIKFNNGSHLWLEIKPIKDNFVAGSGSSHFSSLARSSSTTKSTAAARRHLKRAATQGRLLTQAELLKLGHFRRFLLSSGLTQLDFLYKVEQLRKTREDELCHELDEDGNPAFKSG